MLQVQKVKEIHQLDLENGFGTVALPYDTHLLQNGTDIRSIQELLGHKFIETTMI